MYYVLGSAKKAFPIFDFLQKLPTAQRKGMAAQPRREALLAAAVLVAAGALACVLLIASAPRGAPATLLGVMPQPYRYPPVFVTRSGQMLAEEDDAADDDEDSEQPDGHSLMDISAQEEERVNDESPWPFPEVREPARSPRASAAAAAPALARDVVTRPARCAVLAPGARRQVRRLWPRAVERGVRHQHVDGGPAPRARPLGRARAPRVGRG